MSILAGIKAAAKAFEIETGDKLKQISLNRNQFNSLSLEISPAGYETSPGSGANYLGLLDACPNTTSSYLKIDEVIVSYDGEEIELSEEDRLWMEEMKSKLNNDEIIDKLK